MKQFSIRPQIVMLNTCKELCEQLNLCEKDLIVTNEYIYKPLFGEFDLKCNVLYQEKYGLGEPSDEMVETMLSDMKQYDYSRVIAIGGGTIIDICKLFGLKNIAPVVDLYDRKLPIVKDKTVVLVPTTCGTGSEVTNISILELKSRHTKLGLAVDELYADMAVLIPELLKGLPFKFFATSSIDALIHAVESALSPKASAMTEIFSYEAINMILSGYKRIAERGQDTRMDLLGEFHLASTYAGIAFGNAGCAAVHAMSYPLGANYHVPHGEANYTIFIEVMKTYLKLNPGGKIQRLAKVLANILECGSNEVFVKLEELLNHIIQKKALHEYGVTQEDIQLFVENVMTKQGRLMANNYVTLERQQIEEIYKSLY